MPKTSVLMKMNRLYISSILFFSAVQAHAQTINSQAIETNWNVRSANQRTPASSEVPFYNRHPYVIYTSETEAVLPVNLDNKTQGVVKVNDRAVQKWRHEVKGAIIGIGRLQENILMLHVPKAGRFQTWDYPSVVTATLLNPATGKVVSEKTILNNDASGYSEVQLLKSENGDVQQILVRHTKWSGKIGFNTAKMKKEVRQTGKIALYSISKDLSIAPTASYTANNDNLQFFAADLAANGDLYILWATENDLQLEQYAKNGNGSTARLTTSFKWVQKWDANASLKVNPSNAAQVLMAVDYAGDDDKRLKSALFDFGEKKVKVADEVMSNKYRDELEQHLETPEGFKNKIEKRFFNHFCIVDLAFHNNRPIVIKEMRGFLPPPTNKTHGRWFNGDAIITVYDQNMTVAKNFFINKYYDAFIGYAGQSFGYRIKNNRLQFLTNDNGGVMAFTTLFGSIDLEAMKWEKLTHVKEGSSVAKRTNPVEAGATAWFSSTILLNYLKKPLFDLDITSRMQVMTFQ